MDFMRLFLNVKRNRQKLTVGYFQESIIPFRERVAVLVKVFGYFGPNQSKSKRYNSEMGCPRFFLHARCY